MRRDFVCLISLLEFLERIDGAPVVQEVRRPLQGPGEGETWISSTFDADIHRNLCEELKKVCNGFDESRIGARLVFILQLVKDTIFNPPTASPALVSEPLADHKQ